MLFNSLSFLVFFPIVVITYFLSPNRYRWVWLLSASYYFYMCWKIEYIFLIIASTLIDYYCGIQMGKREEKSKRRPFLLLSLLGNLGLLFLFKYFNFFNNSIHQIFNEFNIFYNVPAFEVLLPVGISFYTFQTLSYSIEVYKGKQKPEKHLGIFALYVSFFPQLVAGPIERSVNLLPQFYKTNSFDYTRVTNGMILMAWGFFKKLVIADKLGIFVDAIYNSPHQYTGFPLILATYFFGYQIYCDFSGYSDIAIGAAQIMGIELMRNFERPYFSRSIAEFWRRWHISLSTWFRDYLYIPLGGNRVSEPRLYLNLMIVFIVSGLWHGANWTFVIWGALHGIYLVFSIALSKVMAKTFYMSKTLLFTPTLNLIKTLITFNLVTFAWIFFRSNSLTDAWYIVTHLFTDIEFTLSFGVGFGKTAGIIVIFSIVFMEVVEFVHQQKGLILRQQPIIFRWSFYYVVVISILLFGELYSQSRFIYFQF